jgi:small-conductance mechanosensitive channel
MRRSTSIWRALAVFVLLFAAWAEPAYAAPPPAPSASGIPVSAPASVHIHDRQVFSVRVPRAGHSATERAQHATKTLEHAVEDPDDRAVRVDEKADVAIVYLGDEPIIQLGDEDAAAEGDASLSVHAAVVAGKVSEALQAERRRSALATTVFSISLLVFTGLMAFLALGKLSNLVGRGRTWIASRPTSLPSIRVAGIDIVRPTALRGVVLVGIDASKWLLRLGVVYAWLLFALSLFDATKVYSERLTGFVLAPLSGLVGRIAAMMPVLFIGAVAALVVLLLLRFVALTFEGVARGEPTLSWLPADLAGPTSLLVRVGIVLVATTIATPLVTGNEDGPLARGSLVALGAIGLALIPLVTSASVGATLLYTRRVKVGEFIEIGGRSGRIREVAFLGVCIEDALGCEVLVPHLASLLHPIRRLGSLPPVVVEVSVAPSASVETVTERLSRAADPVGNNVHVALSRLSADEARYVVTVHSSSASAQGDLLARIAASLREAGIPLGRSAP